VHPREQPDRADPAHGGAPQTPAKSAFPTGDAEGSPRTPLRVALALHTGAAGVADHLDLFIGPDACADRDARIARTYRLPLAAIEAGSLRAGTHDAVELEPHRAEYLALASARELSGGRGRVEPVFSARAIGEVAQDGFLLRLDGTAPPLRVRGARERDAHWTIAVDRA